MKRTTQDDSRENRQIEIFGLTPGKGRSNKYIPDASIKIKDRKCFIELKTSDIVKKAVSTARDFGLSKIEAWCDNDGFIISQYEKTDDGFTFTRHYFLTPNDLKPFFDVSPSEGGLYIGVRRNEAPGKRIRSKNVLRIERARQAPAARRRGSRGIGGAAAAHKDAPRVRARRGRGAAPAAAERRSRGGAAGRAAA